MNSFSDELEKLSYAMGMNMGEYLSHTPVEINREAALAGMRDFFAGSARLSAEEYAAAMQTLRSRMQQAAQGQAEGHPVRSPVRGRQTGQWCETLRYRPGPGSLYRHLPRRPRV